MLVLEAIQFATERHKNQTYGHGIPYLKHLMDVAFILEHYFPFQEELVTAGILHDILEDTETTYQELVHHFGKRIAGVVQKVTNPTTDQGRILSRKEKHRIQYPIIAKDASARVVKLADRIANVYAGSKKDMYRAEQPFFKEMLYPASVHSSSELSMWKYLETLLERDPIANVDALLKAA